jgi:hypothetical protein
MKCLRGGADVSHSAATNRVPIAPIALESLLPGRDMMRLPIAYLLCLGLCLGSALPALASGPEDPVRAIMDTATALWDDKAPEGTDYFDATRLPTLYTKAFAAAYRAAAKFPVYEEGTGPFGYDVITNGQDGCPLKDVAIVPGATKDGVTDVKVTFKLWTCVTDGTANMDEVSELHFDVVTEDGKPVIADIHRIVEGEADSLMQEMRDIAKNGSQQ